MKPERSVVLHQGTYKSTATVAEAVFMITGMTIGAGVLGIPYAISRVGVPIGILYIAALGVVMLFLNLMIGEIAVRTNTNLQLPGLAGKYLGSWAKQILSVTIMFSAIGALLAYIIGEGEALAALLGGDKMGWSIIFWSLGSLIVAAGLERVKLAEKFLSSLVIGLITLVSLLLLPHIKLPNLIYSDITGLFLPYGVILFALHGAPAIAESHALLPGQPKKFRQALIIGTCIPIVVYALFALAVVGVTGAQTTEVATVGLTQFGRAIGMFTNIFAILAMSTAFMGLGTALKEMLVWDHKVPSWLAKFLVITVPLVLFLAGFHNFVSILSIIGGLFIGLEAVFMVAVYVVARRSGILKANQYGAHHGWFMAVPVFLVFSVAAIHSVLKLF